jgi:predicted membrane-bound spermidine synthase
MSSSSEGRRWRFEGSAQASGRIRHPGELDAKVVEISQRYLSRISGGAFEDPRLSMVVGDGAKYVVETKDRFEIIIVDSGPVVTPNLVSSELGADHYVEQTYRSAPTERVRRAPAEILSKNVVLGASH